MPLKRNNDLAEQHRTFTVHALHENYTRDRISGGASLLNKYAACYLTLMDRNLALGVGW